MPLVGYPLYSLTFIRVCQLLAVVAALVRAFPLLSDRAYAGFSLCRSSAMLSHLLMQDEAKEIFGPALLLILTIVSWYFRPDSYRDAVRKIILADQ